MAASAAVILPESPSMKKAVPLINAIDTGRFPRLLSRILQKLHLKAESSFSEEEEEKLQAAFSLEKQELHLVLETIAFVLEQLETVGWQLNLQMAHSTQAKLQSPQAVLQLGVSQEDSKGENTWSRSSLRRKGSHHPWEGPDGRNLKQKTEECCLLARAYTEIAFLYSQGRGGRCRPLQRLGSSVSTGSQDSDPQPCPEASLVWTRVSSPMALGWVKMTA
uniref:COMM domain-containing protein 10 isoform X2 n=1 Tax=Myodes glareolus TaxID=447135 RepID=UPI0020225681|nr:COMM domain-containing protein 10 isoform X2 [Myodes glareolus]